MSFVELKMDASRICNGLSKIGYTPVSAICDIIDNSVNAKATRIIIEIEPEKNVSDAKKNNVREYRIIDDGIGMDEQGMRDALALGSPEAYYSPGTLSKFGLGLKSASFSQGQTLDVISSKGNGTPFLKYRVSLREIMAEGKYGAEKLDIDVEDQTLIDKYLPECHGTIIRIGDIHKNNHPAIKNTVSELQQRIGIIYYFFLKDASLTIAVDGMECPAIDVLFSKEADKYGNLDENTWNGRETRWIEKPITLPVDKRNDVFGIVEVTQLPHPPTFEADGKGEQTKIRRHYRIDANNYGYYIYRNGRLISWAERFQGPDGPIIPQDQDYYSFRGRIQITSDADEALNIDVKKSELILSDEAEKALRDFSDEYRSKSKAAWLRAKLLIKQKANQDPIEESNRLARQAEPPDELPSDFDDSEEDFEQQKKRESEIIAGQDKRFNEEAKEVAREATPPVDTETNPEELEKIKTRVIAGDDAGPDSKIFLVRNVEEFALWEPYFDADRRNCVRINQDHRFARLIYFANEDKPELKKVLNLLLLQLAAAEVYVQKHNDTLPREQIKAVLQEYRRVASEFLASLAKEVGVDLLDSDGR